MEVLGRGPALFAEIVDTQSSKVTAANFMSVSPI